MESKVKAIKLGSVIAILSLICFCIIGFDMKDGNLKNVFFTIFSGIFTSAFVTIFIYATEYGVIKKEVMEEYWNASFKVNQKIMQIPFLVFDEPNELIKAYFKELSHNIAVRNILKQLPEDYNNSIGDNTFKILTEAENKMIEYIRPQYNHWDIRQQEIDEVIRSSLKGKMSEYEKNITKIIEQYVEIADITYEVCENAFGKMYFFKNQKFRNNVYKKIHKPLRDMLNKIKIRTNNNFKPHLEKEGYNIPIMIDFISELQKDLFEIEYVVANDKRGDQLVKSAKNQFYFNMDKQIEDFRTEIYHCNPEYQKEFYSFNRMI